MTGFEEFLLKEGFKWNTIRNHEVNLKYYTTWAKAEKLDSTHINYRELLDYMRYEQDKGISRAVVNMRMQTVSHWLNFNIKSGQRTDNPAERLRMKGREQKVEQHLLSWEELEEVYRKYAGKDPDSFREKGHAIKHRRNTVVLGLMIFQALRREEIGKLRPQDIDLMQSKVHIGESGRSAARELDLVAMQILPLHVYQNDVNPAEENLFGKNAIHLPDRIIGQIKKEQRLVKSHRQLRSSTLVHWVRTHPIRRAQYMAGHRHISSTEAYRRQDLEKLSRALSLHHPLNSTF